MKLLTQIGCVGWTLKFAMPKAWTTEGYDCQNGIAVVPQFLQNLHLQEID